MSLQEYATRRYDLLAVEGVQREKDSKLDLVLFSEKNSGQLCVGIQKLAQRWLLEFLTEIGSMAGKPERGSYFMTAVRTGRLHNQTDVIYAFTYAESTIRPVLQAEETDDMPADERLARAELISVAFFAGYAEIKVAIHSVAGNSRTVIMPVSTIPR
jgi:hypothetical protein